MVALYQYCTGSILTAVVGHLHSALLHVWGILLVQSPKRGPICSCLKDVWRYLIVDKVQGKKALLSGPAGQGNPGMGSPRYRGGLPLDIP
jgi:hypothetical protein